MIFQHPFLKGQINTFSKGNLAPITVQFLSSVDRFCKISVCKNIVLFQTRGTTTTDLFCQKPNYFSPRKRGKKRKREEQIVPSKFSPSRSTTADKTRLICQSKYMNSNSYKLMAFEKVQNHLVLKIFKGSLLSTLHSLSSTTMHVIIFLVSLLLSSLLPPHLLLNVDIMQCCLLTLIKLHVSQL